MNSPPGSAILSERIESQGKLLGLIVRAHGAPDKTTFLTECELPFQAGFIVYSQGGAVEPHFHHPVKRCLEETCEALLVWGGSCWVDFYDGTQRMVSSHQLKTGDLVILYGGGHGVRMPDEKCVLFEIKQGPYPGVNEKERFTP